MLLKPKKSLGQNFLLDKNIINKIIDAAKIEANDVVLEVGPGTGNLTQFIISKKPKKIYLVEKDENLANELEKQYFNKITIIKKDILKIPYEFYSGKRFLILGNLPYNISTKILSKWCLNESLNVSKMILMFQKEVADRIISNFNSSFYGRLTILSNWKLNIKKICDISPTCFSPRPKIESSLLHFTPKDTWVKIKDPKNIEKITRIFFSHRRKMLKKPFNQLFKEDERILKKLKIDLNLRPQNLDLNTYYKLIYEYENLRS